MKMYLICLYKEKEMQTYELRNYLYKASKYILLYEIGGADGKKD